MATDLSAKCTVPLRDVQDVFGMYGRRKGATESRILQGRDARSVRVLVPDCCGLEENFHDITVVDMGELSRYPSCRTCNVLTTMERCATGLDRPCAVCS